MNLLMLIIIFLALIICASIGFIAWELTRDDSAGSADKSEQKSDKPGQ